MLGLISIALGTGFSIWNASQQSKQAQAQARYQQQISENNQRTLGYEADYEADEIRSRYRRMAGAQLAAAARSGRSVDGSVSDIFNDTKIQEEKDIMATMYKTKAAIVGEETSKGLSIMQARNAKQAGRMSMLGSLLSGAGRMYGAYPSINN